VHRSHVNTQMDGQFADITSLLIPYVLFVICALLIPWIVYTRNAVIRLRVRQTMFRRGGSALEAWALYLCLLFVAFVVCQECLQHYWNACSNGSQMSETVLVLADPQLVDGN
jgi:hypothetical protein